jgi:hypothetical protein
LSGCRLRLRSCERDSESVDRVAPAVANPQRPPLLHALVGKVRRHLDMHDPLRPSVDLTEDHGHERLSWSQVPDALGRLREQAPSLVQPPTCRSTRAPLEHRSDDGEFLVAADDLQAHLGLSVQPERRRN